MANNDEEVPYRSPVDIGTADDVSTQDEQDFSTLLYIQKEFNREMRNLSSIDAFKLKDEEDGLTVPQQIVAYKKAKEVLEPLQSLVNTRVAEIKGKQEEGR